MQIRAAPFSEGTLTTVRPTSSSSCAKRYHSDLDQNNISLGAVLNFSYACNDDDATSESTSYRFPDLISTNDNLSLSLARSQCCTVQAYDVPAMLNPKCLRRSVQINAFPSASTGVELCCHDPENGKSSFFNIDINNEISRIQLIPLSARQKITPAATPALSDFSKAAIDRYQAAAVMLIVSHASGLSIYSLVFTRTGNSDLFSVSESRELSESTESCTLRGRRVTDLQVKLVIIPDDGVKARQSRMQPHLLLVTASTTIESQTSPHKVDVFAYPLVDHICPVFRFSKGLAAPIPVGYRYHSELLSDVDGVKNLSFGHTRPDGSCSLAVLSKTQLQILQLPSLQTNDEKEEDSSNEATISLAGHDGIGEPALVIPYIDTENFVILCRPKIEEIEFNPPTQVQKRSVSFSLEELPTVCEKNGLPLSELDPQGTPWREGKKSCAFFQSPIPVSPGSAHPFDETLGDDVESLSFISPDPIKPRKLTNRRSSPASLSPLEGLNLLESPASARILNNVSIPDRSGSVEYLAHILFVQTNSDCNMNATEDRNKEKDKDRKIGSCSLHKIQKCALPHKLASFSSASMTWIQAASMDKENSMFLSPSPHKQVMFSREKNCHNKTQPLLCVATNQAGSSQLQFAVLSSSKEGYLQNEFDRSYETKHSLVKPLNNVTRKYEIRSIALESYRYAYEQEGCTQLFLPDVRILLYAKNDDQNPTFSKTAQDPIVNSVLTEDGRVVVGFVSLPLFDNNCSQTMTTDSMSTSLSTSDPAMAKLEEIANSFRRFEARMTKRMEGIERVLSDNTSRIQQLEKAMDNLTALEI